MCTAPLSFHFYIRLCMYNGRITNSMSFAYIAIIDCCDCTAMVWTKSHQVYFVYAFSHILNNCYYCICYKKSAYQYKLSDTHFISMLQLCCSVFMILFTAAAAGGDDSEQTVSSDEYTRTQQFTLERMSEDSRRLITESSSQPQPFILVGSELGALIAR